MDVPAISPASGSILSSQTISISIAGTATGAEYSLDNENWTTYTTPFTLANSGTVYARATDGEGHYSNVVSNSYTLLPYDAEIEYVESTGTQYIDTEYYPNSATHIEIKGRYTYPSMTVSNSMHFLFGARDGSIMYDVLWNYYRVSNQDSFQVYLHFGASQTNFNQDDRNVDVTVDASYSDGVYYNGTKKLTVSGTAGTSRYPIYLLWCNADGAGQSNRPPYGRLYYCKIWDNNTLVRDYIPVRVGTVGYMYDKVSGVLFGNSGSGNFTLGNDITT